MEVIKGIPVAPGVVVGRAFVLEDILDRVPFHPVTQGEIPAELQRFAARFGVTLDERVLTERAFSTPLDKQPGFEELRLAATTKLRVLQAVERKYAADLLDRASLR